LDNKNQQGKTKVPENNRENIASYGIMIDGEMFPFLLTEKEMRRLREWEREEERRKQQK